jgi:hypothetical protein
MRRCEHGVFIYEQDVCSFSNIASHRNRLLLILKRDIERTVASLEPETFRKVVRNALQHGDACLREGGGRFQHLL